MTHEVQLGDVRLPARFWVKVRVADNGCWEWTASRHHQWGYGSYRHQGRTCQAHRVAYEVLVAPLPQFTPGGVELDHTCCNPSCVNPAHLELVQRENAARAHLAIRSRTDLGTCGFGHAKWERDPSRPDSWRCMVCQRDGNRTRHDIMRAAARRLGLPWREYVAEHGRCVRTAERILAASDGVA